jgi:hypothetical protein
MNSAFIKKYVQQGFCVFPLPYKSKVPFQGWNWKVLQTRKPSQSELESWFQGCVNCAIVTGRISGNLAVLDFDTMTVFPAWLEKSGLESATVITGKGCHIYVRVSDPESLHNGNFQIDGVHAGQIRFDGGYVVAPPSIHPTGKRYFFLKEGVETVTVHDLCIEQEQTKGLAKKPVDRENVKEQRQAFKSSQGQGVKQPAHYAREALRREAEQVKNALPGTRNSVLFRAGLKTRKYGDVLGDRTVFDTLVKAGLVCGLSETESTTTIKKAWHYAHY